VNILTLKSDHIVFTVDTNCLQSVESILSPQQILSLLLYLFLPEARTEANPMSFYGSLKPMDGQEDVPLTYL
jgi:hypothetical protein